MDFLKNIFFWVFRGYGIFIKNIFLEFFKQFFYKIQQTYKKSSKDAGFKKIFLIRGVKKKKTLLFFYYFAQLNKNQNFSTLILYRYYWTLCDIYISLHGTSFLPQAAICFHHQLLPKQFCIYASEHWAPPIFHSIEDVATLHNFCIADFFGINAPVLWPNPHIIPIDI